MPETYELSGLEIAAAGDNLNHVLVTQDDLANMASAFEALRGRIDPPLKLEHDKESLAPAVGWPSRVYVQGKKLLADVRNVPRMVYELIKQGAYRKISPEIYWNLTEPETGAKYPCVLAGVALLGGDLPAMTSLEAVSAMYHAERGLRVVYDVSAGEIVDFATWTAAYINDLPDSSFLYIEPGGDKDGEGKTTPRSLRHFPVKDASGKVDLPHLRNALARIPQSDVPADAKEKATAKAQRMLKDAGGESSKNAAFSLMDLSAALSDLGYCAGYYCAQGDKETESAVRDLMVRVTALMNKVAKNDAADVGGEMMEAMAAAAAYQARATALRNAQVTKHNAGKETNEMTPEQEKRMKELEAIAEKAKADAVEFEKLKAEREQFKADQERQRQAQIAADAKKFVADCSTPENLILLPVERDPMERLYIRCAEGNGTLRKFAVNGQEVTALDDLKALVTARKPLRGLLKTYSAHTEEPDATTPQGAREKFAAVLRETRSAHKEWDAEQVYESAKIAHPELVAAMESEAK